MLKQQKTDVVLEYPCFIRLSDSKHSNGNKEIVAISIEDFILGSSSIVSDGYRDTYSSLMVEHLSNEFSEYTWTKNSSQQPFDIYSLDAGIAIENKNQSTLTSSKNQRISKNNLVVNATIYPSEAKVKDVLPKKKQLNLSKETLESYMDVLVVVVDKNRKNGKIVRYRIVDGGYWGFDYDDYMGCKEMFPLMNNKFIKKRILSLLQQCAPNNTFIKKALQNDSIIDFNFRKLIYISNPTIGV